MGGRRIPKHLREIWDSLTEEAKAKLHKAQFDLRYRIDPENDCWIWTGSFSRGIEGYRYGIFKSFKIIEAAHRYSYRIHNGDPGKKYVCHSCDNPKCVNPEHLFLGTQKENVADMDKKGRRVNGQAPKQVKSAISKALWQDPEYRAKQVAKRKGRIPWNKGKSCEALKKPKSEEAKAAMSLAAKKRWEDPAYRDKWLASRLSPK